MKGIFVSEQRNALKQPFLLQKLFQVSFLSLWCLVLLVTWQIKSQLSFQSYPGWIDKDTLALDLVKLAEVRITLGN